MTTTATATATATATTTTTTNTLKQLSPMQQDIFHKTHWNKFPYGNAAYSALTLALSVTSILPTAT